MKNDIVSVRAILWVFIKDFPPFIQKEKASKKFADRSPAVTTFSFGHNL